jgi:hypothetical protein
MRDSASDRRADQLPNARQGAPCAADRNRWLHVCKRFSTGLLERGKAKRVLIYLSQQTT